MIRFMVVWALISLAVGAYQYFFSRTIKKQARTVARKTLTSMVIGLIIIAVLMTLNNVSGV